MVEHQFCDARQEAGWHVMAHPIHHFHARAANEFCDIAPAFNRDQRVFIAMDDQRRSFDTAGDFSKITGRDNCGHLSQHTRRVEIAVIGSCDPVAHAICILVLTWRPDYAESCHRLINDLISRGRLRATSNHGLHDLARWTRQLRISGRGHNRC